MLVYVNATFENPYSADSLLLVVYKIPIDWRDENATPEVYKLLCSSLYSPLQSTYAPPLISNVSLSLEREREIYV